MTDANATPIPASSILEILDRCCDCAVSPFTSQRRRTSNPLSNETGVLRGAWSPDASPPRVPCLCHGRRMRNKGGIVHRHRRSPATFNRDFKHISIHKWWIS